MSNRRGKSRYSMHSVMANPGFGPVTIIAGKRPKKEAPEKYCLTAEEAFNLYLELKKSNESVANQA